MKHSNMTPGLERVPAVCVYTEVERQFLLACAGDHSPKVVEMLPYMTTRVRERGLKFCLVFDHIATAQVLLTAIGTGSIDDRRYQTLSRQMQKVVLNFDPDPQPQVKEPLPVYYVEPAQGELPL